MDKPQKIFGTDGIRGKVGDFPMTVDFILKLGWAVGSMLAASHGSRVLIGKDTRISGYMIESALQAGLSSAGTNIYLSGPMPTPGIAYLTQVLRAQIGIVISASHNPFDDNGIKFFDSTGFKISRKTEKAIEHWFSQPIKTSASPALGKATRIQDAQGRYIEFCKSAVPRHTEFNDLKIVLDCANGATYHIAPYVFSELGLNIIPIYTSPDGMNINVHCGSIHPETIQKSVLEEKADLGIAFDGDGDRVIMIDHRGEILDGDEILYIIAKYMSTFNGLRNGVIGTDMSNKGLELACYEMGLNFLRVPVGDQNIIQALHQKKWILGGESSGHIINLDLATTADGVIAALQVLLAISVTNKTLHELKKGMTKFPQKLLSIPHQGVKIDLECEELKHTINQLEEKLGKKGRLLLRYSGTEPLIRIMVEAQDSGLADELAEDLAQKVNHLMKVSSS